MWVSLHVPEKLLKQKEVECKTSQLERIKTRAVQVG